MTHNPSYIKSLRERAALTQQAVAHLLQVSRPTYIQLEAGKTELSLSQAEALARLYGLSLEEFSAQSQRMYEKYKEMILAFLRECPSVPKTKLAKLVYLSDFAWFYNHLTSMSGMPYRKIQYGPVPDAYFRAISELEEAGKINIERKEREGGGGMNIVSESSSNRRMVLSHISKDELALIKKIAKKWDGKRTDEIVNFTHQQLPYSVCREDEIIPYSLITQEDPENVY
jgi:DNA-binding XRE family transcriptional regulator